MWIVLIWRLYYWSERGHTLFVSFINSCMSLTVFSFKYKRRIILPSCFRKVSSQKQMCSVNMIYRMLYTSLNHLSGWQWPLILKVLCLYLLCNYNIYLYIYSSNTCKINLILFNLNQFTFFLNFRNMWCKANYFITVVNSCSTGCFLLIFNYYRPTIRKVSFYYYLEHGNEFFESAGLSIDNRTLWWVSYESQELVIYLLGRSDRRLVLCKPIDADGVNDPVFHGFCPCNVILALVCQLFGTPGFLDCLLF